MTNTTADAERSVPRFSRRTRMGAALFAVAGLATAAGAGLAGAGNQTEDVASYSGCLSRGGALTSIQPGEHPAKPCEPGSIVAHFSSGDITDIVAGAGLTGGATNGAATLALAPSYQLPQGCAAGQQAEWSGPGWSCADDDSGTVYTAGEGLALNGTQFSLRDLYQLPQDCELGQTPVLIQGLSSQLRDWGCATPPSPSGTGSTAYLAEERNPINGSHSIGILSNFQPFEMVRLDLPPGSYTFSASGSIDRQGDLAGGENIWAFCDLEAAGVHLHDSSVFLNEWGTVSVSLDSAAHLPSGGAVTVSCKTSEDGMTGKSFRLVATSVSAIE